MDAFLRDSVQVPSDCRIDQRVKRAACHIFCDVAADCQTGLRRYLWHAGGNVDCRVGFNTYSGFNLPS